MNDTKPLAALDAGPSYDFCGNKMPKCPHCGDDFDITDNEAWFLYDDNNTHEVECPNCDHEFKVNAIASWVFSTDEQDED